MPTGHDKAKPLTRVIAAAASMPAGKGHGRCRGSGQTQSGQRRVCRAAADIGHDAQFEQGDAGEVDAELLGLPGGAVGPGWTCSARTGGIGRS
jgi:hypothetical protein